MDPTSVHPLKSLLQLQLATDSLAATHVLHILNTLTSDCFQPSSHSSKWTARISSLLHAKDPSGRWAGLVLAHKTSLCSRNIMIEFAQNWLGVVLPMLSRNEPTPNLKAAIRLIRTIFSAATDVSEYQRQVSTPNVPKFTTGLLGLVNKHPGLELKVLVLSTLTHLIPLYPSMHKASHTSLSSISLRFLNGGSPHPTNTSILKAASKFYATLHLTGGKVGAASLWRKSVDETLAFGSGAFQALRTTDQVDAHTNSPSRHEGDQYILTIPLNLDRLRSAVTILSDLLQSSTQRPVQLPIGPLAKFGISLLRCTADNKMIPNTNPEIHAMQLAVVPDIWKYGCDLIISLAQCVKWHLTPHVSRIASIISFHLEQKPRSFIRLPFLNTLEAIFTYCHPVDSSLLISRVVKTILPSLSIVLQSRDAQGTSPAASSHKKNKKRMRGYEGDEVFRTSREIICPTVHDGEVLLKSLDVLRHLQHNPELQPAMGSISSRVLLSMLLSLPQMAPGSISHDLNLHSKLWQKVRAMVIDLGTGTRDAMSESLGLTMRITGADGGTSNYQHTAELLLHPRVPPLIRSMPHVGSLSLFHVEESQEETEAREKMGLGVHAQTPPTKPVEKGIEIQVEQQTLQQKQLSNPVSTQNQITPHAPPAPEKSEHIIPAPLAMLTTRDALSIPKSTPHVAPPRPALLALEEDEDEEMPAIDINSDSD